MDGVKGTEKEKKVNIHKGHRQKVKSRYSVDGLDGMPAHNVLELLLFFGIPQRDTNPIAHELISKFGSLSAVFEAKESELLTVKGMTGSAACLISMILPLYKKYSEDLASRQTYNLTDDKALVEYLRPLFLDNANNERLYMLCFDSAQKLICCKLISEGDNSSSSLDLRAIVSCVLETKASYIILAHNHPHGIVIPSNSDIQATQQTYDMLGRLKVILCDHLIITDDDYFSMRMSAKYTHIFYGLESVYGKKH